MFSSIGTLQSFGKYGGVRPVLTQTEVNALLGQANIARNSTYAVSHINLSETLQYCALCIYLSQSLPGGETQGGIWVSSDGGLTFNNTYTAFDTFSRIVMSSSAQYMYCSCANAGRIYYSNNYGQSWTSVSVGTNISSIAVSKSGQIVYATDYGTGIIYRSTNYGVTYASVLSIGSNKNIANIVYKETLNKLFWTSGRDGNLYSYNLLTSQQSNIRPNGGSTNCSGVAVSDDGKYVHTINFNVGTDQAWSSSYNGTLWSPTSISVLDGSATSFSSLACSPNGKFVYTTNGGMSVYFSADYGKTYSATSWASVFPAGGLRLSLTHANTRLVVYSSAGFAMSVTGKLRFSVSGTPNVDYVTTTNGFYTYVAFATNQTLTVSTLINVVPLQVCVVGGGGGGGIGNSTLSGNCNGGMGGSMAYGVMNASLQTYVVTVGAGGAGAVSTSNGLATTGATIGGNSSWSNASSDVFLTAYGGHSGTWNTSAGGSITQASNPSGTGGSGSGFVSSAFVAGGLGGKSQGSNGQLSALAGGSGNLCPLPAFAKFYNVPFGGGGTGGANNTTCASAAPFAGGGHSALSQAACGAVNATYKNAVLTGVANAVDASGGKWNSTGKANDTIGSFGRAASHSGAGGGSAQSQGNAGNGGSGIVIVAVLTEYLLS